MGHLSDPEKRYGSPVRPGKKVWDACWTRKKGRGHLSDPVRRHGMGHLSDPEEGMGRLSDPEEGWVACRT